MITPLQGALLIFGFLAVVAVILFSRREKDIKPDRRGSRVIAQPRLELPENYGIGGEFDEFGVGRARRRGDVRQTPEVPFAQLKIDKGPPFQKERRAPSAVPPAFRERTSPVAPAPVPDRAPAAEKQETSDLTTAIDSRALEARIATAPAASPAPVASKPAAKPAVDVRAPSPPPPAARKVEEKIVTLLIAQRERTAIPGPELHRALEAEGLSYGPMQIYHRKHFDKAVFSVASLIKPGFLIPDEAESFSTLGLSAFMMLPGPASPEAGFEDMLATVQRLAERLDCLVYDSRREQLSPAAIQASRAEIAAWSAANSPSQ
jgi:cell division protein ZipA